MRKLPIMLLLFIFGTNIGCMKTVPNGILAPPVKDIQKERPTVLEKWKKAVIHVEGASDSEHVYDFIKKLDKLRQQLEKKEITQEQYFQGTDHHAKDKRFHGTALFVLHNKKRYLVTARHVVFDENSAKRELQEEEKRILSWPENRRAEMVQSAKERLSDQIFKIIFRVPSLDEVLIKMPNTHREFLMNLGAGGPSPIRFQCQTSI